MAPSPPILTVTNTDAPYVLNGENVHLSWIYDPAGTGNGAQLARQFRWSINGGQTWTNVARSNSASTTRDITSQPGQTMTIQGQCYDQDNAASGWSESVIAICLGPVGSPVVRPPYQLGVNSHLVLSEMQPRTADGLDQVQVGMSLGAEVFRDEMGWDEIPASGVPPTSWGQVFNSYLYPRGGKLHLVLDYSNPNFVSGGAFPNTTDERAAFLDYATKAIQVAGVENLAAVEIWNEWNIYMGWWDPYPTHQWGDACPDDPTDLAGCPKMYAALVETLLYPEREGLTAPGLRTVAPGVPILGAALEARDSAWLTAALTQMKARSVQIDGIVVHPYVEYTGGCGSRAAGVPGDAMAAVTCAKNTSDDGLAAYGYRLPLYITEYGWNSRDLTTEDQQARWLVEFSVRSRAATDVARSMWYDLMEDVNSPSTQGYGLVERDQTVRPGRTKPAGFAMQALQGFWAGTTTEPVGDWQASNRTFTLGHPDGTRTIVLDATEADLTALLASGNGLVDLLGQVPDVVTPSGIDSLVGHHVGAYPGGAAPTMEFQWLEPDPGEPVDGTWIEYPPGNGGYVAQWNAQGQIYSVDGWVDVWGGPVPSAIEGGFTGLVSGQGIAEIISDSGNLVVTPTLSGGVWTLEVRDGSETGAVLASTSWVDGQRIAIGYASGTCHVRSGSMDYSLARTATNAFFCFPDGSIRMQDVQVGTWPLSTPPLAPTVTPSTQEADPVEGGGIMWTHQPTDGTAQTAYEVRSSTDGGTTWTSSGEEQGADDLWGSGPQTADTTVLVQVRTWGGYIVAPGPWSESATINFVAQAAPTVRLLGISAGAQTAATTVRLLGVGTNAGADSVSFVSPPQGTVVYPWDEVTVEAASVSGASVTWSTSGPLELLSSTGTTATVRVLAAMPPIPTPTGRTTATVTATLTTGESGTLTLSVVPQVVWAWDPATSSWVSGGPEPAVPTEPVPTPSTLFPSPLRFPSSDLYPGGIS